jgi:hypothetical protein
MHYPAIRNRADAMLKAATAFGVPTSTDFPARFKEQSLPLDTKQQYLLEVTDRATELAVADAIAVAGAIADKGGILSPVSSEGSRIHKCFEAGTPASGLVSLADIINAGWKEYIEGGPRHPALTRGERFSRLTEVILKTIEVMEFEIRTETP